jgi:hypothetical protein
MNEASLVLFDTNPYALESSIIDWQIGNPVSVEFDFEKVWSFYKNVLKCDKELASKIIFLHSHPCGFTEYSSTDLLCAKSLRMAFGFPIRMQIITFAFVEQVSKNYYIASHKEWIYDKEMQESLINRTWITPDPFLWRLSNV